MWRGNVAPCGSPPTAAPGVGMESGWAPEKGQTTANQICMYNGHDEGARAVSERCRKSRQLKPCCQEPSKGQMLGEEGRCKNSSNDSPSFMLQVLTPKLLLT
jgi:hypothetical protein